MTQPSSKFLRHANNDSLYNTVSSPGMEGQSSNKKLNKANAFRQVALDAQLTSQSQMMGTVSPNSRLRLPPALSQRGNNRSVDPRKRHNGQANMMSTAQI
jgi:hypothetical protein